MQLNQALMPAFPDMELPIHDMVAEGEKVLVRLTIHATHTGAFGELEPTGKRIEVNVLAPGFVITGATEDRPAEWKESFLRARALGREQRPDDLVGTALYLLSDLAGFVSGQTIVVDGGHIMY